MYATVVNTALAQHSEIALTVAQQLKVKMGPSYATVSVETLAKTVHTPVQLCLDYLANSDLTPWKKYCDTLVTPTSNYANIIQTGECLQQTILEFFQKELTKPGYKQDAATQKVLQTVANRLDGLAMVAKSVVMRANLARTNAQIKQGKIPT
jgi:hypothetical protein